MRRFLFLTLQLPATIGLVAFGMPALADTSSDLTNAALNTAKQSSYHISITTARGTSEGDVVNPDRMHMTAKTTESILIGPALYVKYGGAWHKMDGAGVGPQTYLAKDIAKYHAGSTSTDLGMRVVEGAPLHAYRVTNPVTKRLTTIFIDSGGRIARVESATAVVRFSKFNEPVTIRAPI